MVSNLSPGAEYVTDDVHRAIYSRAACIYVRTPEGVLYPRTADDLGWAIRRAAATGSSLTLRGGGSGLAGQSVGEGMVVDLSRWMTGIISLSPEKKEVVVQPGVVLSQLNRAAAAHGLRFGADPSSRDFCTIGGMLANNSKGPHSVKYGTTLTHVKALSMLLSDGSKIELRRGARKPGLYSHPYLRRAAELIEEGRNSIESGWPRSRTNSSGYNLKDCLGEAGEVDLLPLFVGSEGTLAVFFEAVLGLEPIPSHRSVTLLEFPDVVSAGRAVIDILPLGPSACEILDDTFLDIIRRGLASFPLPVTERAGTILIAETDGYSREEAEVTMDEVVKAGRATGACGYTRAETAAERATIWSFRKAASPLLNKGRGRLKSTRFIEDGAVPTDAIPAYLKGVAKILSSRKIETVIFGHAGDGNFHVNPFIDLKDSHHFKQAPIIAREVAELLADLGGSLSGEHGDGRLRTPFLPIIYGELTHLFRKIKVALDPGEILNPGIIAPASPEPMEKGLRFSPAYRCVALPGRLSEGGWAFEVERCHGCGTCRNFCPTAQATRDDLFSGRGRGHLLQALLSGELDPSLARKREIRAVFESCIGCSRCALHCPTGVNIASLASAFREAFTPPLARLRSEFLGKVPSLGYKTGPTLGRLLGRIGSTKMVRLLNRGVFGLRTDLLLPTMAKTFAFDPSKLYHYEGKGRGRALYFYGCYGNTYNPSGEAALAVAVLRALGVEVIVPPQACCGVSKMARGLVDSVAPDVYFNRRTFMPWIERGFTLVTSAPSCLLALSREQPRFFPEDEGVRMAEASTGLFTYIREFMDGAGIHLRPVPLRVVYQTPCHAAVAGTYDDEVAVLKKIPGVEVVDVTEECCGLAGSFGLEAANAELSEKVAAPLMERIRRVAPAAVVTPCGSCKTQVESHLSTPVYHPLTLLARSLGVSRIVAQVTRPTGAFQQPAK